MNGRGGSANPEFDVPRAKKRKILHTPLLLIVLCIVPLFSLVVASICGHFFLPITAIVVAGEKGRDSAVWSRISCLPGPIMGANGEE